MRSICAATILFAITVATSSLAAYGDGSSSPFGFHPALVAHPSYPRSGYADALDIGVRWTREGVYLFWFLAQPDLNNPALDFSFYDRQYGRIPPQLHILGNVAPEGPRDEGRSLPRSYLPVDTAQYVAFVKAGVERYDGDGIADMPGLQNPIRFWQVGNEPTGTRSGFAQLQRLTYDAIKAACAECQVLIGGVAGMPPVADYIAGFDSVYKPILGELQGRGFDIFDFHWYGNADGDYRGVREVLSHVRSVLTANGFPAVPVWVTEMGAYSGAPSAGGRRPQEFPEQTERQQAFDLFKRFIYSLANGIEKVFPAFGLMEGFKHDGGYFDHTGLIYDGGQGDPPAGTRKLAWYTYKKMTAMLEGADWRSIEVVQDRDGVFLCRMTKEGRTLHVAWSDAPDRATNVILPLAAAVRVTEVLPQFERGSEVVDFASAFRTFVVPLKARGAEVTLADSPVIIETMQGRRRATSTAP